MSLEGGPFYLIIDEGVLLFLDITDLVLDLDTPDLDCSEGVTVPVFFSSYEKNNWDHFSPYITPSELVRKVEESYKMGEKTL